MEDLSEYLRRQLMHKRMGVTFGKLLTAESLNERAEGLKNHRKETRTDMLSNRRQISTNMTPYKSPTDNIEQNKKKLQSTKTVEMPKPNKRLEMLAKWKQEKEKKKIAEKQKTKPLFKVTHVTVPLGLPDLENVNKEIKGKLIKSFAPPGHKFKAPDNVKPIKLDADTTAKKRNRNGVKHIPPKTIVTRSQAKKVEAVKTVIPAKALDPQIKLNQKPDVKKNNASKKTVATKINLRNNSDKILDNKESDSRKINNTKKSVNIVEEVKTPKNKNGCTTKPKHKSTPFSKPSPRNDVSFNIESQDDLNIDKVKTPSKIKKTPPNIKNKIKKEQKILHESSSSDHYSSMDYSIKNSAEHLNNSTTTTSTNTSSEEQDTKTPDRRKNNTPPLYISPFVTISRGKENARKEYISRNTNDFHSPHTSPKAAAAYFTWILDTQIARLQELSQQWDNYKNSENVPEEAASMIDVAIGQTNLLITKKFVQFRGLIETCRSDSSETKVTSEDLHGFWDLVKIQVNNLDKRFENLENLKANNWEEILPLPKKNVPKKNKKVSKNVAASSGLRAAIAAARKQKLENGGVEVPVVVEIKAKTPRKSLVNNVATTASGRKSSPGLTMMKIAQYAKGVETPGKSILKTDNTKSCTKSVVFQDQVLSDGEENDINAANTRQSIVESASKAKTPTRRSRRLSTRSKLF